MCIMPFLGTFVYAQNRKSHVHRLFFILTILISYWAFTEFNLRQSGSYGAAFFWIKASCFKILLSPFLIHFILTYIGKWEYYNKFKAFTLIYLPAILLALLDLVSGAITGLPIKESWGWSIGKPLVPSVLIFYFFWKISALIFVGKETFTYLKKAEPNERISFSLFFYGIIAAVILGIVSTYISSTIRPSIPEMSIIIALLFSVYLTYIIWKYNFFLTPSDTAEDIIELMADSLILTGSQNKIVRVNRSFLELSGFSAEKLIGTDLSLLLKNIPDNSGNQDDKSISTETRLISETGQSIPVLLSKTVVYNKGNMPVVMIYIIKDLTFWNKAQKEFIQAEKLQSYEVIIRSIVHDFNNLLASISGHLTLAECSCVLPEPIKKNIAIAEKATEVAANLTNRLSMYAKESGVDASIYNISEIIQESADLSLKGSCIQFDLRSEPDLWQVRVDRYKMIQVFINLFINARQAMPNAGKITVICMNCESIEAGKCINISVHDNGDGIPADIVDKVFNPFFTTKGNGTGLGLAIVKNMIEAHQGRITVESEYATGTTFTIILPLETYLPN